MQIELGPDQPGEILLKGPTIMKGYLNDDKANAETFTEDGWLRTGDVAKYDSKYGEFFIIDRIKELIKYKGYQVAPAGKPTKNTRYLYIHSFVFYWKIIELEALLMSHPSVADCCVIGVYDAAQATEIPRAYIVLQPTVARSQETVVKITQFVNENVVDYKKLRGGIRFIDQVPKSPSGKILRRTVKEWVKQEQEQQISRAHL